jgi:hypothetical protein
MHEIEPRRLDEQWKCGAYIEPQWDCIYISPLVSLAKGMQAVLDKQMTAQYNFYQVVCQLEASFQEEVSNKSTLLTLPAIT